MTACVSNPLDPNCTCKSGWNQVKVSKDAISKGNPSRGIGGSPAVDIWTCCGPDTIDSPACKAGGWTPSQPQQVVTKRIAEKSNFFPDIKRSYVSNPYMEKLWCKSGYIAKVSDSSKEVPDMLRCVSDPVKWYTTAPSWADDISISYPGGICGNQYKTCCASGAITCEAPDKSPDKKDNSTIFFVLGGVFALLFIILIILIVVKVMRKKKLVTHKTLT